MAKAVNPTTVKFPLVMVEWLDHCSHENTNWRDLSTSTDIKPLTVFSVGWLAKDAPEYIVLVPHFQAEYGMCTGELCVMKASIRKKTILSRASG